MVGTSNAIDDFGIVLRTTSHEISIWQQQKKIRMDCSDNFVFSNDNLSFPCHEHNYHQKHFCSISFNRQKLIRNTYKARSQWDMMPQTPPPQMSSTLTWSFLKQGCTNPGDQVTVVTKFCTVASNICGPSVWYLLHVTLLAPTILRWLLDFWRICATLLKYTFLFSDFRILTSSSMRNSQCILSCITDLQSYKYFVLNVSLYCNTIKFIWQASMLGPRVYSEGITPYWSCLQMSICYRLLLLLLLPLWWITRDLQIRYTNCLHKCVTCNHKTCTRHISNVGL